MNARPHLLLAAALMCGAMLVPSAPLAQDVVVPKGTSAKAAKATGTEKPTFAAPVMLKAGEKNLGEKRLYPSPVLHDMNGDGLAVGDLFGYVTVAHRLPGDGPAKFGEEARVQDHAGKDIKFNNW